MVFSHIGIAISTVGAVMNSEQSFEMSHKLSPGVSVSFMDWQVDYQQTHWYIGNNYTAEQGEIHFVSDQAQFVLKPERRHYPVRVMNMSEPAIKPFWHGDYYVTLGSKVDVESYAVKIQYKAYISWVWGGVIFALLGSLIPLFSAIPQFRRVPNGVVHKA
jgi:cytochrome c-type biogenesis protein CcmF